MRRILSFDCQGDRLAATLDEGTAATGLLIISGGNEIRIGAHRGMAKLAQDVAAADYPVFRFDRRGVGDSEGKNSGFTGSGADIAAAVEAFQSACPALQQIIAFGNCDAASALMIHRPRGIDAAILANPWVIELASDLPPPAAIKARYVEKLRDPRALLRLFTGGVNLRKLMSGLRSVAKPAAPSPLADQVAMGMAAFAGALHILLAERDGTAIAFADQWKQSVFIKARGRADVTVQTLDSASHSFASDADYAELKAAILSMLECTRTRSA
jgi:exosortase A-associated hydrolase 1